MKVVQINSNGMQRVKYIITPGDLFGSLSYLLHGEHEYTEYGVAVNYVQLTMLSLDDVKRLCNTEKTFETALLEAVGKRIIKIEKRLDAMVFGDSEERIVNFVNEYIGSYGKPNGDKIVAPNLLTHHEVSTLTATSRQTVTRVFNRLRAEGFIEYDTHRISQLKELLPARNTNA